VYKNYLRKHPNCTVCGQLRIKDTKIKDSQLEHLRKNQLPWYAYFHGGIDELFKQGRFTWACDDCIQTGRAIKADIGKQLFCDNPPYLAYYGQLRVCESCKQDYTFSKEEKQHWYEVLGFWVQSVPKNCKECRRRIREEKKLNNELSALIRDLDKNNPDQLLRAAALYDKMGKYEKVKLYVNLSIKALPK
jgi:hypothetical protein